jgi:predicted RNA binding protein YcfA (HicA-like mRNA interferase family)
MSKLPATTGPKAVAAFGKAGFEVDRIRGSHHILKKSGHRYALSIPCHKGKTLGIGLLRSQIDKSGLTEEEFIQLLGR